MSELKVPELYQAFSESEYGRHLEQRTRWDDFRPEWATTELWCDLLGDDVNNLRHMPHTTGIAVSFAAATNLSVSETDTLLTTAITHDWGEAIIGDIPLPAKTEEDEKKEFVAYRHIAQTLFGNRGDRLADRVLPVLGHEDKEMGDMFRAVEYVGYCTTALRAGRVAVSLTHGFRELDITRKQKEGLIGSLLSLENAVKTNGFSTLTQYVKKYKIGDIVEPSI